ncbi:MAG: hypothetical protein ACOYNL_07125 [Rickettsiales bacterium]
MDPTSISHLLSNGRGFNGRLPVRMAKTLGYESLKDLGTKVNSS